MKKTISIIMLAFLTVGTLNAQTAESVVAKYIEAIGGAKKWKALKSIKVEFKLSTQGVVLSGTSIGDNVRERMDIDFNGMKITQAYDGKVAWSVSPPEGINEPTKLTGEQAKDAADAAFIDEFIDYKAKGVVISLEADKTFKGKVYSQIKLVDKEGVVAYYFFDKETGYKMIKREGGFNDQVDTYYSDYKDIGGVVMFMKSEVKAGDAVQRKIEIETVQLNVKVTDDMFAFPGK